jgi:ATP-dependent DNA ligase
LAEREEQLALRRLSILTSMTFEFCLPTKSTSVPDTPDWLHEVKYDGYRLRVDRVRLIT